MTTDPGWERGPTLSPLTVAALGVGLVSSHSSCARSVELPARIIVVMTANPRQNLCIMPPLCLIATGQPACLSETIYGRAARFGLTACEISLFPKIFVALNPTACFDRRYERGCLHR